MTSVLHLLSVYSHQANKVQAEIADAVKANVPSHQLAPLFDKQSALVHALIRELTKQHDRTLQEHTARIAVLQSLDHLAWGLTRMADGLRVTPPRPTAANYGKQAAEQFGKAVKLLKLAKQESHKARELLGCHDSCSILL